VVIRTARGAVARSQIVEGDRASLMHEDIAARRGARRQRPRGGLYACHYARTHARSAVERHISAGNGARSAGNVAYRSEGDGACTAVDIGTECNITARKSR